MKTFVDGGSRKPRVVTWMTRAVHVKGHVSPKLHPSSTVIVRRAPLRKVSTRFVIPRYTIDQSCTDAEEVDPHFVAAALICARAKKIFEVHCQIEGLYRCPAVSAIFYP